MNFVMVEKLSLIRPPSLNCFYHSLTTLYINMVRNDLTREWIKYEL